MEKIEREYKVKNGIYLRSVKFLDQGNVLRYKNDWRAIPERLKLGYEDVQRYNMEWTSPWRVDRTVGYSSLKVVGS